MSAERWPDDMCEEYIEDWRNLGFYCDHDTQNREYRLIGSRSGLRKFSDLLRAYVADPRNEMQSEHEHYGPYGLEVYDLRGASATHVTRLAPHWCAIGWS